jgi:alpha-L-fucosidase
VWFSKFFLCKEVTGMKDLRHRASALFAVAALAGLVGSVRADVVPSPPDDLLLQANGGVAAQSSTTFGAPASNANDGNRAGNFFVDGSTSHTDFGLQWLEVKTPAANLIGKVIVWNRTDCCSERLSPFEVQIFNGAAMVFTTGPINFNQTIFIPTSTTGASGDEINIPGILGDRVRVQLDRQDYLHLAELEAYAIPEPTSVALLAIGGLGATVFAWRRKRRMA